MLSAPGEVLAFWYGDAAPQGATRVDPRWFTKNDAFDDEIRRRFGEQIDEALQGGLQQWALEPDATLALILVLDQFTRNVFRGTARAFAGDARALELARSCVDKGWDRSFPPLWRWFCYMPFEHSESLTDQHESLRLFGALRDDPLAGQAYEWAVRHKDVIERFGRYPHRNDLLGRPSTADEIEFLRQPGSRF